jgi:hypothetical protein
MVFFSGKYSPVILAILLYFIQLSRPKLGQPYFLSIFSVSSLPQSALQP